MINLIFCHLVIHLFLSFFPLTNLFDQKVRVRDEVMMHRANEAIDFGLCTTET